MHAALARRGIRVDQGWVDAAARAGCTTEEQLFVQFLAHDLRKAATAATLPRPLGATLGGAWVLQVEAVADVGEPAPRHATTSSASSGESMRTAWRRPVFVRGRYTATPRITGSSAPR